MGPKAAALVAAVIDRLEGRPLSARDRGFEGHSC